MWDVFTFVCSNWSLLVGGPVAALTIFAPNLIRSPIREILLVIAGLLICVWAWTSVTAWDAGRLKTARDQAIVANDLAWSVKLAILDAQTRKDLADQAAKSWAEQIEDTIQRVLKAAERAEKRDKVIEKIIETSESAEACRLDEETARLLNELLAE